MKTKKSTKVLSVLLSLMIVIGCLPFAMISASAQTGAFLSADESTIDNWKDIFKSADGNISTENAGGIWTDKSVFTNNEFASYGITKNETNSFMVSLSAMTSNMTVTGQSNMPTDTVLVLDASGSMNDGNNDCAEELIDAANQSIQSLLDLNSHNRVGVVVYSGTTSVGGNSPSDTATLLLPLDRYKDTSNTGEYLVYNISGSGSANKTTEKAGISSTVISETTGKAPSTSKQTKTFVGATYTQRGIMLALEEFMAAETYAVDEKFGRQARMPIMVLMSDGVPTTCSTSYADPFNSDGNKGYNMGDGSSSKATDAMGFVTQLSASYAKAQINGHYDRECLLYTMGLGSGIADDEIATSVMNPIESSEIIEGYWVTYSSLDIGGTMTVSGNKGDGTSVKKIAELEMNYVDSYFEVTGTKAEMQEGLAKAFASIIKEITNRSKYFPNLSSVGGDLSDSVSITDKLGKYMVVTDVKGIIINDELLSGADASKHIVDNRNNLSVEIINAIQQRLGFADAAKAEELIYLAYANAQISYKSENEFSNYISWYANANGEYLGFYQEGGTTLPETTGNVSTDPAMIIKSYIYFGQEDADKGISKSDMLLAAIYVEEDIETGDQTVMLSIPEKLIPTVYYDVSLNTAGNPTDIQVSGATGPFSFVYETALNPEINIYNCKEFVSEEYLAENTNADGTVNFYSNLYEADGSIGYDKDNTYCYFEPSLNNDRYYYLEDTTIYSDKNGTVYSGEKAPNASDKYYRQQVVYIKNGSSYSKEIIYHELSSDEIKNAKASSVPNQWVIPKGTVNTEHGNYEIPKDVNSSNTIPYANKPFVDYENPKIIDGEKYYVVGSTLGNNGKITYTAETGIKISKTLSSGTNSTSSKKFDPAFEFVLTNITNPNDNSTYNALRVYDNNGTSETTVSFTDGVGKVYLKANESIYICGMTDGDIVTVEETETAKYVLDSINGNTTSDYISATVVDKEFFDVKFTNRIRGTGTLTVSKEITHDFGDEYSIPNKEFEFTVTLSGVGTANATFNAVKTDSSITTITTDANGKATFTLKHNEKLSISGIPEGSTAKVVESGLTAGFNNKYLENNVIGDGNVTIENTETIVNVVNDYNAQKVKAENVSISGVKTLNGRDWKDGDIFTFQLQKRENSGWTTIATQDVLGTSTTKSFDFTSAILTEEYTEIGSYLYRVIEVNTGLGGVEYDDTVHQFTVGVTDNDMDGFLEISEIKAYGTAPTVVTYSSGKWNIKVDFNNNYSYSGTDSVTLSGEKVLNGRDMIEGEFEFGLYKADSSFNPSTTPDKVSSNNNGKFSFNIVYGTADVGNTYYYVVKELNAGKTINGVTYSDTMYKVTVNVEDDTVGGIRATAIVEKEDSAVNFNELNFTNTYAAAPTEINISGNKVLNGIRELEANEFTFEMYKTESTFVADGAPLQSVTNAADGKFSFDSVTVTEAKTYYFTVKENNTVNVKDGVSYDNSEYQITVVIADDGQGQLYESGRTIVKKTENSTAEVSGVEFVNEYDYTPITPPIEDGDLGNADDPDIPNTNNNTAIVLWFLCLIASCYVILIGNKKHSQKA